MRVLVPLSSIALTVTLTAARSPAQAAAKVASRPGLAPETSVLDLPARCPFAFLF